MTEKSKIKIVKKSAGPKAVVKPRKGNAARLAAREMVSTVSGWVSDFKTRRAEESRLTLEKFFAGNTQPSES